MRGGDAPTEIWFVYRDKLGNIYMCEHDHINKGESIPATVSCIEAGKKIKFTYKGTLKKGKLTDKGYEADTKSFDMPVNLEAEFEATTDCFEFSRHMSTEPIAQALSKEKFTKEFLQSLSENHQVHYEQSGHVTGIMRLGYKDVKFDKTPALRDHSYGKRDWNYFDRYLFLVALLENGDFIHNSMIRYPTITELQAGFYTSNGKTVCIKSSTSMDSIPSTGEVPESFSYDIEYEDGTTKKVTCELEFTVPFAFAHSTFYVNEGVSTFTIDGIKGRGITEFGFNADKSRWNRNV